MKVSGASVVVFSVWVIVTLICSAVDLLEL